MHPCLLQAPHGEQAAHLPALGRLSWASSQNTPCQLTQGFPWTGVRKPLCTLSIWSTLNEPYSSQTPQSDKHLHYGKKVAIFIFHSGEDEWLIQTQVSHPTLLLPWASTSDSSKADMAAAHPTPSSTGCLPSRDTQHTDPGCHHVLGCCSVLAAVKQARRCSYTSMGYVVTCFFRPDLTCFTSRVSRESLSPCR